MAISTEHLHLPPGPDLDMIIIGQTRRGKSATGNSILRREEFTSDCGWDSVTQVWSSKSSRIDGRVLRVVDTPGFGDPDSESEEEDNDKILNEITGSIVQTPEGFDALLLVFSFMHPLDWNDRNLMKSWIEILGEESFKKRGIVVMTHGDLFNQKYKNDDKMTIDEWWSKRKEKDNWIWELCGKRCALFQNKTKDYTVSRQQLFDLVSQVDFMNQDNDRFVPIFCPIDGLDPHQVEIAKQLTIKVVRFKQQFCLLSNAMAELESSVAKEKPNIFDRIKNDADGLLEELRKKGNEEIYDCIKPEFSRIMKELDKMTKSSSFSSMKSKKYDLFEVIEKIQRKLETLVENSVYWQTVKCNILAVLQIAGIVVTFPACGVASLVSKNVASRIYDTITYFRKNKSKDAGASSKEKNVKEVA